MQINDFFATLDLLLAIYDPVDFASLAMISILVFGDIA